MKEKRVRFSFGRYKRITVSDLSIGVFKKLPKKATFWFTALLDTEEANQKHSLTRLASVRANIFREITETEPIDLALSKNRLYEIEILIRTRIHKDSKTLTLQRSELQTRLAELLLSLDRAKSDATAIRHQLNEVQSRNNQAFDLALGEIRKLISRAFNPSIEWQIIVSLFPKRFPSGGGNAELELASWVHSDPQVLANAIKNINDDLNALARSDDEDDILRNIVNFARECRGGKKIQKDDWFDYRAGMFSRSRVMPLWVTDATKLLGIEYQTNFYLGTELVASGNATMAFGLAFELIPGTIVTSSKQSLYQEPANGWSFGSRRYNLGGDRQ